MGTAAVQQSAWPLNCVLSACMGACPHTPGAKKYSLDSAAHERKARLEH